MNPKRTYQQEVERERTYQEETSAFYNKRSQTEYIWQVPEKLFLLRKKYFKEGSVIVDMGCGPSTSIKNSIPKSLLTKCTYIGIDISKNALRYARINVPSGKFLHGDIASTNLEKSSVDDIISLGALHHTIDKKKTLRHWASLLNKDGKILLMEPTYEVLKKGQGESPVEEGIKTEELLQQLKPNKLHIVSYTPFSTPAFHFFNRCLIKVGLGAWRKVRLLWYPVIVIDVALAKLLGSWFQFFKGEAFMMVIGKI